MEDEFDPNAPPLGFIEPDARNNDQIDAHDKAAAKMMALSLAPVTLPKGKKIILSDFLKNPDVIADMGMAFPGYRQITGSCVGVTEGEITALLSAVQRTLTEGATRAFIPWWPYAYGRTRFNEGDRGPGEGAVSSVMGETLEHDGTFAHVELPGLPAWNTSDGLAIARSVELAWSDGGSKLVTQHIELGRTHRFGARTPVYSPDQIVTLVANGYAVANGCAYYVGDGAIHGSGDTAYVRGKYNGRGGHETSWMGVWHHPNDGMLYLYWNHWPTSTYSADPAGGPRCSVWLPESEVLRMLNAGNNGIARGEAFGVSHVDYFPAQPKVLDDWSQLF